MLSQELPQLTSEHKQYQIIYADPPWRFCAYSPKGNKRSAEQHYRTMDADAIRALPVASLAAENCILFLWVTMPCLLEGLSVLNAWGFTYKTAAFVWVKKNRRSDSLFWGMGYWTRSNAEFCLLATKGKPKRLSTAVHQVILSPVEEHSRKPAEVRARIVQLAGDVPRIELFARQKVPGWDVWGNEVESDVVLEGGVFHAERSASALWRRR